MAFRLNAAIDDSGVPGRDRVKSDRRSIAPSLAIGLKTPTRTSFNYLHAEQSGVPDGGVPTIGLPGYRSPSPDRPYLSLAARPDPSNFYGTSFGLR